MRDKALSLNLSRTLKTINKKKQILFMSAVALSMSLMSCNDSSKETPEEKMRRVEQDRQEDKQEVREDRNETFRELKEDAQDANQEANEKLNEADQKAAEKKEKIIEKEQRSTNK